MLNLKITSRMRCRISAPLASVSVLAATGALLLAPATLSAQTDTTVAQLPGSEVRVEKLFDARLADAERIGLTPSLPSLDTSLVPQTYEVLPVDAEVAYAAPKIRPLAIKVPPLPTPYKGFFRVGAGLPGAWLGDAGYAINNDRYALRADAHTYGFNGNFNDAQRYAEVDAHLGGTLYATDEVAVDLDVDFGRRQYRYYGFEEARRDTSEQLFAPNDRQHFNVLGFRAGVRNSAPTTPGVDYRVRVAADFLSDNFAVDERLFHVDGLARKDFTEAWYAELAADLQFVRYSGFEDQKLNIFQLQPTVGAHFDKLGLRLGVNVANEDDAFRFYPRVEATYAVRPTLVLLAGADGGPRAQSYRNLTRYLPYLVTDPELRIAQELRVYGGVQTRVRGIDVEATAGFERVNDLALFVSDSARVYQFRPRYDSADIVFVKLEASAPLLDRLSGNLQVESRSFSLETADEPYLLPSFDAQLRLRYDVSEKIGATGLLVAQNTLPVLTPADLETAPETGALVDFSIHGDYRFSQRFAAFAHLNNLFNNRRRMVPYYPVLGTNVMLGVTGRF